MIVVLSYSGHRIEVPSKRGMADGTQKVKTRPFPLEVKPRVEVVTVLKVSAELAESAGELWARRYIDHHGEGSL